jgi:hypothetical protein
MSSTKTVDNTTDRADWNHAWGVVSRLAAARGTALHETDQPQQASIAAATGPKADAPPTATPTEQFAPVVPDQLARDIAEIEKAAAALRRQEPALEQHYPEPETIAEPAKSRSVWLLVTTIWISAVLVVTGTIGALTLLFG